MTDIRTDDEIARLFAEANPVPNSSHPTVRTLDGPTGTEPGRAHVNHTRRNTPMIDLEEPETETEPRSPKRVAWLAAAAAIVVGAVGLGVFISGDSDDAPASPTIDPTVDVTTPPTLEPTADADASNVEVDVVERFVSAASTHDLTLARTLATTDAEMDLVVGAWSADDPGRSAVGLADQFEWLEATNWRFSETRCKALVTNTVECEVREDNALSDYLGAGSALESTLTFTLSDGRIASMTRRTPSGERFDPDDLFSHFHDWVTTSYPQDAQTMFLEEKPGVAFDVSSESAQLMNRYLDEYTADPAGPPPPFLAYLDAHNAADADLVISMLAPDAGVADLWATDAADTAAMLAWLDALGLDVEPVAIDANIEACAVGISRNTPGTTTVDCTLAIDSDADSPIEVPDGSTTPMKLRYSSDGLSEVSIEATPFDAVLQPWIDWIASEHPDDIEMLFVDVDGTMRPRMTPEAAERAAALVAEYGDHLDG